MSNLAVLAGGDEYELAALEISNAFCQLKLDLVDQFPFFYNEEFPIPCADSSPPR